MKNKIKFNDRREDRFKVLPLTLMEQETVIDALNYLLENDNGAIAPSWFGLLQRFVDNYSKLEHHRATTCGLYAVDRNPQFLLEEFWQRSSDACPLTCTEAENEEEAFKEYVRKRMIAIEY